MAKFYGVIGYVKSEETRPGVWQEIPTERYYYGEIGRNTSRFQSGDQLNDNLNIANEISIVADPYAYDNFRWIRYVELMGAKWKITNVEPQYPRLILSVGGLYNGAQT